MPRRTVALVLCTLLCASCGSVVRDGRGSSYMIIDAMQASAGARPDSFSDTLASDVITRVKVQAGSQQTEVPTVFEDYGKVTLRLAMKDVTSTTGPTTNNEITVTRYHVAYIRSDGRNTQGIDVPYAFDGAVTGTLGGNATTTMVFVLVRAQAKEEAPLKALVNSGGQQMISTLAQVTFYGRDQVGNDVSVTATISVNFADWGDPQ